MKVDSERSLLNLEAYVKNAQDGEAVKQSQRQEQERASATERAPSKRADRAGRSRRQD